MHAVIRKKGNSKGIILPKSILRKCHIQRNVYIEVKNKHIIITAKPEIVTKRKGWAKAFKEMAQNGDDALVIPDVFNDENTAASIFI